MGATENAIIAACGAAGKTELINCAIEPEIIDLISFLIKLGNKIIVRGRKIIIKASNKNNKITKHRIIFDRIEASTYLIAGALVSRKLTINKIYPNILKSEIDILKKMGAKILLRKIQL